MSTTLVRFFFLLLDTNIKIKVVGFIKLYDRYLIACSGVIIEMVCLSNMYEIVQNLSMKHVSNMHECRHDWTSYPSLVQ